MAIQMRRGQYKDFDPDKMLPGEWAVAIDNDTQHQVIWMCFRSGVVKRIGTYEDFAAQIEEATGDIRDLYIGIFNEINNETLALQQAAAASESNAKDSADAAKQSEEAAAASEANADEWKKLSESHSHGGTGARDGEDVDNSKYYSEVAANEAKKAGIYADLILPEFDMDYTNGHLYCDQGKNVTIFVDNAHVYAEIAEAA